MKRETLKRLMVKGTMTYIAVFALILLVALPALALTASSIGTREIKDHEVRSRDLRNEAVTTDRIAPRAVRRGKIAKRAIRTEHIYNIADSKIKYSTKVGYLSIPARALTPDSDADANGYDYSRGVILRSLSGSVVFGAPVYLPQGAVVTKLRYIHRDQTASGYTDVELKRTDHLGNSGDMADPGNSVDWTGAPLYKELVDSSISDPVINNRDFVYHLEVSLTAASSDLLARNIVIEYTYSSPGS